METDLSSAFATLKSDPQDRAALAALANLHPGNGAGVDRETLAGTFAAARAWHEERGDVELCVQLVDLELGWTPTGPTRAELLVQKARLLHNELLRWEAARSCVKEALETAPGHRGAKELLDAIEDEEASWEPVAKDKLAEAKEAGDRPRAAPLLTLAAELYLKFRSKSPEGEVFLRRALELDPSCRRADLLRERVLREAGRDEDLMELYRSRIRAAPGAEEKAAAEVAAGVLAEKLARTKDAIEHFRRALAALPAEPRALHWMVRQLSAQESWTEVVKLYEAALRATKRGTAEMPLLLPLGRINWKNLSQIDQAELYYRRVKKVHPNHPEVIDFYRAYHASRNEIPQLLALLAQAQKAESDVEARVRLGIELAELAEKRPQSLEKAIDAWKALLRLRPALPEAVAALRRLYTKTEKWNALLELIKDDLESLSPSALEDKVARYLEMIPIYRDRLRLEVMVINTYVAILALKPDHPEALATLAKSYEAQGRWGDLVQIFTRQAEATREQTVQVRLYLRVAQLWAEKFNKHQNAVAALEKILQIAPGHEVARESLRDLYVRSRSWRALVDLMRRELAFLDPAQRPAHLAEMARLAAERLSDARQAIGIWNEALTLSAWDPDALASLAVLYERERRWPALAEILARQAALAGDGSPVWCALLEKRGVLLYEKMNALTAALEDLRRVRVAFPDNPRVLRVLRDIYAQTGDLPALEALYAEKGSYEELCEVLSALAERNNDAASRTRLLGRVAEISNTKLHQPERALKAYERILNSDPENTTVARAAAIIYRTTERWGRLLATYDILLAAPETAVSQQERLMLLEEARRICEHKLNSKALAFQWCVRAYELEPTDPAVFGDMDRLGEEAEEWEGLFSVIGHRLEANPAREEKVRLMRRNLRIAFLKLIRLEEARRLAEAILEVEPADHEAENALAQIFMRGERWPELVGVLERRVARASDPAVKGELLQRIARLQEEKSGDLAGAAETYGRVLELEPQNVRALKSLSRVLEARQEAPALATVLRRQIALGTEEERPALLLRLGRIEETELRNPEAARAAYLQVLEVDSIAGEAVAGLERLLEAEAVSREALTIVYGRLAPYYELTEAYDKWARALETLVQVAPDDSARMPHLELLIHLYSGPLADPSAAYRVALRTFEIAPDEFTHRERLLGFAAEAGTLGELVDAVQRLLAQRRDPNERRDLLAFIAEIEDQRPGRAGDAEAAYRQILELDPLHFGAFRTLTRICRENERWTDLRDLLETRQACLPEVKDRIELLSQIAEIDESLLDDREHAIVTLGKLLEIEPNELQFVRALGRHLAAAERWRELSDLLATEEDLVSPSDLPEIKLRRAELLFMRFSEASAALDLLEGILKMAPDHAQARALIERILEVPAERQRAARMLEPLYEALGQWPRLVSVLEIQREGHHGAEAGHLLARIAELQENRLQARQAAMATWRRALDADPTDARALSETERLATILERFDELVELYQELARKRDHADLVGVANLLSKAARLYLARFSDREAAIRMWRQVLDLDPTNFEMALGAVEALEALYTDTADARGLVEVLRAKIDWTRDQVERTTLLLRIADLEEKSLGDTAAAVATYRTLLDYDGDQPEVLAHLERIFEATGQQRERADILNRRIALAPDAQARRALRFRIAAIAERELGDIDEATSVVLAILDEAVDDRPALETLARLYEKKGATAERLEILERQLLLVGSNSERIELLRQIADLLQARLGRPGEAFDRWREILALAPRDPGALGQMEQLLQQDSNPLRILAAQCLEPLYEAEARWDKLAGIFQIHIESGEDARDRMMHRLRLANLQETHLKDRAAAFTSYGAAIRDALGEVQLAQLLDAYERLAATLGDERLGEVVALYRAIEPDVLDEEVRLRVQRTIARQAEACADSAGAIEYYRKVLDRAPDDLTSLTALERLYAANGDHQALYDITLRRAELATADSEQELLLRRQAGALAATLGRSEEAIAAYERVWTLRPGDPEGLAALDALYQQARQWNDLLVLLERRLALGMPVVDAVGMHFRLAQLELDQLGNREKGLEHLRAVLEDDSDHGEAIARLEALLEDSDAQVGAADLLEPVYVRRSAWRSLVGIDELRLKQTEDPVQRLAWTERIARIYEEQIEDLDEAFRWYGRVFQERPTSRDAHEQILRLAPKLGTWPQVAKLLDDYLEGELSNSDEVLEVVRLAAQINDERLGDREAARKHYRRYVEAQSGVRAASAIFEQALERWEAWSELRDLLEEQAARVEVASVRVSLLRGSARLSEEKLDNRGEAIATLRSILEVDPEDAFAAAELERLLATEERWGDLRDHLVWMLGREVESYVQDALALKIADVEQEHLSDVGAAVERYGEVLARTPGHPAALGALEGMLADANHRARAAEILEPLNRRGQDVRKLVEVLEIRLEAIDDSGRRVAAWREIAELEERLGRLDRALEARGRGWLEDVSSRDTLAEMESLAVASRRFPRLVQLFKQGAEEASDPNLRASLCAIRAKTLEMRLGDPGAAIDAWREALEARADDIEAFLALERLLEVAGRFAELADALEKHLEIVSDIVQRKILTKRVALIYEQALRSRDRAIASWRAVLEIDDADEEALDALARLYTSAASWRSLAEIVQRKIELSSDPGELRQLRFTSARLHDERLEEPFEAASQLRAVLDAQPGDSEALEMLDRIFMREGQNTDLLEVLDSRAQVATSTADRDGHAFRAASLVERELGDVQSAVERYRQILTRSPEHPGAREALWALARGDDHRMLAVPVLEPVLRGAREWARLIELLELRLAAEDGVGPRLEILGELARIEEHERKDAPKAFSVWARAFAEDPADAAIREALERLAVAIGDLGHLAQVYEERLKASFDAELQRGLARRLAELYEGALNDPARAIERWREVVGFPGEEGLGLARLEVLLRQLGRDSELEEVLAREADLAVDPKAQAEHWAALGELRLRRLGEVDGAIDAFRAALERVPTHPVALASLRAFLGTRELRPMVLDILEPLAEARADHAELVVLFEARLALEEERGERAMWLRRIAEIAESKLRDAPRALAALGRALQEDALSFALADEIDRLARHAGLVSDGAKLLETALEALDGAAFCDMALRAARLHEAAETPVDEGAAEVLYARVLEVESENNGALEALEAIYRRRGDVSRLAGMLERRGSLELDPVRRTQLYGEAARLHEGRGDLDRALAAWQAIRQADEGNLTALAELARLHERQGNLSELVRVLEEQARFTDDGSGRAGLYLRMGALKAELLSDLDGAAAAYREVLDVTPDDPTALDALAAIEERRADFEALEQALLRRLSVSHGPEQLAVLFKLADNAVAKLDDADRALSYLHQVLDADADNRPAYVALEGLLGKLERWHDLIEILERRADLEASVGDVSAELAARALVAEIWAQRLGAPDNALEAVGKCLERDPTHVPSLLALARIHEAAERWPDAQSALERAAKLDPGGPARAEIHYRIGRVLSAQGAGPKDVQAHYLAALETNPAHVGVLEALEAIAREASNLEQLVRILALREQVITEDAKKRPVLTEIAQLYLGPLGQPSDAITPLRRLARIAPADVDVQETLGRALVSAGQVDDGERILLGLIDQLGKARQNKSVARLQQLLGTLAEARGDLALADQRLSTAYQMDPTQPATLAALARLATRGNDPEKARRYYRSLLLQSFDEKAVGVTKADVYFALGKLHLQAGETPKARNMFERGLENDPRNDALRQALAELPR